MQIDKKMILDLLRERGQQDQADQANQELPDQVDTDQYDNVFKRFGLDPQDIIHKFQTSGLPDVGHVEAPGSIEPS